MCSLMVTRDVTWGKFFPDPEAPRSRSGPGDATPDSARLPCGATASFHFNLEMGAQPFGDLNFQRAFRIEHKQWLWDLRPSI